MSEPETYNEVMAWFGTRHHAGHYDLHGLSIILKSAQEHDPMRIWDSVLSKRLLCRTSQEFWITPRGKVWFVAWAMHEHLIHWVMEGLDVDDVEQAGWMRVSVTAMIRTKPTRQQLDALARLRPQLTPKAPGNRDWIARKRHDRCAVYDVPEPAMPWTVWVPEVDAKPDVERTD